MSGWRDWSGKGAGLPAGNAGRIVAQNRLEGQAFWFFKDMFSPLWGPF